MSHALIILVRKKELAAGASKLFKINKLNIELLRPPPLLSVGVPFSF